MKDQNQAEANLYNHTHQLLKGHETLLSDANRNRLFYRALKKTVCGDVSLLDIGSGTGIWAIAAARMGAKRVVAIEQDPLLLGLIKTLARDNGVAHNVEVMEGDSRQIELGNEFDIIITETIGNLGFDEQIVPIMIDARERFLKPGGVLIPETVALIAAAAHLKKRHKRLPAGIPGEYGYFESLNLHTPVGLNNKTRLKILSDAKELIRVELRSIESAPDLNHLTARWKGLDTNHINCFAVWVEATLTKGVRITTRQTTSWSPVIYRIKRFKEERGDIEFTLALTSKSNRWTATLSSHQHQEAQSYSPAFAATALLASTPTDADLLSHLRDEKIRG